MDLNSLFDQITHLIIILNLIFSKIYQFHMNSIENSFSCCLQLIWIIFDFVFYNLQLFKMNKYEEKPIPLVIRQTGKSMFDCIFRIWSESRSFAILLFHRRENSYHFCCGYLSNREVLSLKYDSFESEKWVRSWADD